MSDKCYYCGKEYHPMPVWELAALEEYKRTGRYWYSETNPNCDKPLRIQVCHLKLLDGIVLDSDCPKRAKADGYVYRPALTLKR